MPFATASSVPVGGRGERLQLGGRLLQADDADVQVLRAAVGAEVEADRAAVDPLEQRRGLKGVVLDRGGELAEAVRRRRRDRVDRVVAVGAVVELVSRLSVARGRRTSRSAGAVRTSAPSASRASAGVSGLPAAPPAGRGRLGAAVDDLGAVGAVRVGLADARAPTRDAGSARGRTGMRATQQAPHALGVRTYVRAYTGRLDACPESGASVNGLQPRTSSARPHRSRHSWSRWASPGGGSAWRLTHAVLMPDRVRGRQVVLEAERDVEDRFGRLADPLECLLERRRRRACRRRSPRRSRPRRTARRSASACAR